MRAKAIFVGGTASHVGKSWMATAICRVLRRRGFQVAPFKAQNMSNNSFPCAGGYEIGRAQVAQAEACGLEPEPDMNPVLLKPVSNLGSQVVVNGKVWKNLSSRDYYHHTAALRDAAHAAYHRLAARFQYIVMEGAGSVAELNLKDRDIVNLSMARAAGARALLVGDIDRGGIFASILGTLHLLDEDERALVHSFAVNRFRGDPTLFEDGVRLLEQRSQRRCLGVFPFVEGAPLVQQEDSVSLDEGASHPGARIAIVRFPRVSNFTDFRLLRAKWITQPVSQDFHWVILPGTKNTIGDLEWLRATGLAEWVRQQHARGARVLGVCGGYQMLGHTIADPQGVENESPRSVSGLGLLPLHTVLTAEKIVRTVQVNFRRIAAGAYEIHMGRSEGGAPDPDLTGAVTGTYLHGLFEHSGAAACMFGEDALHPQHGDGYQRLADWFERHADLALFEELYL
ncbi:MAG: cobyric acid synthase [Bryobacteraceae bacterium]|nr:cobyric acid synthase [Bryobacteraceae bacterium]